MPSYIEMPKLSDTMTEGTVVKWRKAVGDSVEIGEVVAEVETDKAVMELEAFAEGKVQEIYVPEGGKARIGQKLAVLTDGEGETPQKTVVPTEQPIATAAVTHPIAPSQKGAEPVRAKPAKTVPASSAPRPRVSPLARKLAGSLAVDLEAVKGTGPGGRIIAQDVRARAAAGPGADAVHPVSATAPTRLELPKPASGDKRIPLSGMRRAIADRLLASKTQIPHFYLQIEADAGELVRLRAQVNAAMEKAGLGKLTVNDFILKAALLAAARVPRVNAAFAGDAVIEFADIHLAVAVAVEDGLVTPVIREAQKKSLRELSDAVKDLAQRARTKKLKPDEYQGGTLTVTNLGSYGIESFSAIINPPQAAILAVGAIVKKPVVDADGRIVPGERIGIGLSADHRVVDGAIAAQFLARLREFVENPTLLLLA